MYGEWYIKFGIWNNSNYYIRYILMNLLTSAYTLKIDIFIKRKNDLVQRCEISNIWLLRYVMLFIVWWQWKNTILNPFINITLICKLLLGNVCNKCKQMDEIVDWPCYLIFDCWICQFSIQLHGCYLQHIHVYITFMCGWLLFNANSAMFAAISWREQVSFQWDDDELRFVLDQHV